MTELTLFSVIDKEDYEKFVIPFIFFPLVTNSDVKVEVLIKNYDSFITDNEDAISLLELWFPKRFLIRSLEGEYFNVIPCGSTARFYLQPQLKSKWTKITDVDIMHIEGGVVSEFERLEQEHPQNAYFALKRPESNKLSGTMCVKTDAFYTREWEYHVEQYIEDVWTNNKYTQKKPPFNEPHYYYDEFVNYDLVIPVHGLPEKVKQNDLAMRPIQGIHMSLNRPAYAPPWQPDFPDWGITPERKESMNQLRNTRQYEVLSRYFHESMNEMLNRI